MYVARATESGVMEGREMASCVKGYHIPRLLEGRRLQTAAPRLLVSEKRRFHMTEGRRFSADLPQGGLEIPCILFGIPEAQTMHYTRTCYMQSH